MVTSKGKPLALLIEIFGKKTLKIEDFKKLEEKKLKSISMSDELRRKNHEKKTRS